MNETADNGQKATLLVLEDEGRARNALVNILTRRNYHVINASSGSDVINLMSKHDVDLLLLDIRMERPDGIDVATRVNQSAPGKPIVFTTAFTENNEYRRRVAEAGLNIADWIQKPIDPDHLIKVVEAELRKSYQVKSLLHEVGKLGVSSTMLLRLLEILVRFTYLMSLDELKRTIKHLYTPSSRKMPLSDDINYHAFYQQKDMLLKKYGIGYVAFLDGAFIGYNKNWEKLIEQIHTQHNRIDVFTAKISNEDAVVEIISPQITQDQ